MKAIDELRNHVKLLRDQGLMRMSMDTVDAHLAEIEREMEEEYVALPKDAYGDVWHVGNLVVGEVNPNNPKRVERMLWYGPDSGWQLETDSIIYPRPERPRHYKEPTVEDVLWELLGSIRPEMEDDEAVPIVRKFAERLQLLEGE